MAKLCNEFLRNIINKTQKRTYYYSNNSIFSFQTNNPLSEQKFKKKENKYIIEYEPKKCNNHISHILHMNVKQK